MASKFMQNKSVRVIGVEAAGEKVASDENALQDDFHVAQKEFAAKPTSEDCYAQLRVEGAGGEAEQMSSSSSLLVRCRDDTRASLIGAAQQCVAADNVLVRACDRVMLCALALLPLPLHANLRIAELGLGTGGGGALHPFLQRYFSSQIQGLDLVDAEGEAFVAAVNALGFRNNLHGLTARYHAESPSSFLIHAAVKFDLLFVHVPDSPTPIFLSSPICIPLSGLTLSFGCSSILPRKVRRRVCSQQSISLWAAQRDYGPIP